MMKISIVLLICLMTTQVFAGLSDDYEKIKNSGRDLEPTGAICEEVAQLRFVEKYPAPKYQVITGIDYSDAKGSVGELDLIVFNTETSMADVVAEVKCWKSPKNGLEKAKDQRQRFLTHVRSSKPIKFKWLDDPTFVLTKEQFSKVSEFYFIAQAGTQTEGFDYELPYTLKELMQLRSDVLNCQARGQCPRFIRQSH
jgi:hypothetical protein